MIHTPSDPCKCGLAMWVERWVATKEGPKMLSDWVKKVRCAGCGNERPKGAARIVLSDEWSEPSGSPQPYPRGET